MADPVPTPVAQELEAASWHGARLAYGPSRGMVSVRARGAACARVARALELAELPRPNEARATPRGDVLWLRPDEWLVVLPALNRAEGMDRLEAAVGNQEGAVVDVSASRVVLELSGPAAREVLSSCCTLDLHPRSFGPSRCAQSLLARAPVLLQLVDDTPMWRLFVRPTLASYVVDWLLDGMQGLRAEEERSAV